MKTIHNPATQSLSKLSTLSLLTELQIEGFTITNQSIAALQSLTQLARIAFNFDHFEADLQQFPWFPDRANLVSLTTGRKPGLPSTMGSFTTLTQLCYGLGDSTAFPADIVRIGTLTTLTKLSLNCYQIADMSLAPLQSLKKLTMLSLTKCNFLTDAALIHLAGLPKLQKLMISDGQINGTGFSHLVASAISELDLFFSKGLSNDGLAQIAKISSLQVLKLGKSSKTTNDGIALLTQLPLLRELVVRRCYRFSPLDQLKLLKKITVE